MQARLTIAVLIACCAISCDRNDPKPQALVTFTLEVDHDAWMFASDAEGKLLDWKQLVFGEPVTLNAVNPPEKFSLTIVRKLISNADALDVATYTGIPAGSVFTPKLYEPLPVPRFTQTGKCYVKIVNYPNQKLPLIVANKWQSNTYPGGDLSSIIFTMNIYDGRESPFLFSTYDGDLLHPVYKFIPAVAADDTVMADFNTFKPYEKTIDLKGFDTDLDVAISFQLHSYSPVWDLSPDQSHIDYRMSNIEWVYHGTSPTVRVGYLDELEDYYMSIQGIEFDKGQNNKRTRRFYYFHFGPINTSVEFPDEDLIVSNKTMAAFDFNFTGAYQMRSHIFSSEDLSVVWRIYSGPGSPSLIAEVPEEIMAKYPALDPASLKYGQTGFYTYDDGADYEKILEETFTVSFGPQHQGYIQTFPE